MAPTIGFVGLGNIGHELASNLVAAGHRVLTHDLRGSAGSPDGAVFVDDLAALAQETGVVVLSLPDGDASEAVARSLAAVPDRAVTHVVDTSTIGPPASRAISAVLTAASIGYVDAPVSGGVSGARARTLVVMYAGAPPACAAVLPVLEGLSDHRFHVGDAPGMAQVVKLANNFLSATALAATSEAIAFGTAAGVDMATMLDVLNASSGQSATSRDKFVDHVLPDRYASGFLNTLMAKDLALYLRAAEAQRAPHEVGSLTEAIWSRFAALEPGADFTRIYPFVRGTWRTD